MSEVQKEDILSILYGDFNSDSDGEESKNGGRNSTSVVEETKTSENILQNLEVGGEITLFLDVVSPNTIVNSNLDNNQCPLNISAEDSDSYSKNEDTVIEITNNSGNSVEDMDIDMEITDSEGSGNEFEDKSPTPRSRKRTVCKKNWKMETRKRKRQSGEEYEDRKGNIHRGRQIQGECKGNCKFKCTTNVTPDTRKQIHLKFWSLSDTGKNHFYSKFVERHVKQRTRTLVENNRKYSYFYYLGTENNDKVRVCKEFFFKTLDISQRRIYYFFDKVYDVETCTARSPLKGKNTKSHISDDKKIKVRDHINSFPRVEAHYCRRDSKKQYLESSLTLTEMYRLYKNTEENPVTESLYRWIFNHEFNLEFLKPKKDRCDICESFKCNVTPSEADLEKFNHHEKQKNDVKIARDIDRETAKKALDNTDTCVVAFDLENVFALPKAEVSNFFYKRKLNCYNLTAHSMYKGQTQLYCMVWHEMISGRAGNHIASAVYKILKHIMLFDNTIKKFVLWSDSCVPQNKNSIMTLALQKFLTENPSVNIIVQRFSEPGHGVVQEVDSIHSNIERWLKPLEVFSPLSLVRILVNKANKTNTKMNIIQMLPNDFFDFQTAAKTLNYAGIPYTKIKEITINSKDLFKINYRMSFTVDQVECLINKTTSRKRSEGSQSQHKKRSVSSECNSETPTTTPFPRVKNVTNKPVLTAEKKKDIYSMLKYMPPVDRSFYSALFKSNA